MEETSDESPSSDEPAAAEPTLADVLERVDVLSEEHQSLYAMLYSIHSQVEWIVEHLKRNQKPQETQQRLWLDDESTTAEEGTQRP